MLQDIPPPGSYEVSESHTKSQGRANLSTVNNAIMLTITIGKNEPNQRGKSNSVFLSGAERFAPPRDILLEEPDAFNPGT